MLVGDISVFTVIGLGVIFLGGPISRLGGKWCKKEGRAPVENGETDAAYEADERESAFTLSLSR